VLASEPLRQALGQRGKKRVEHFYDFDEQSRQYQQLFTSLCRRRKVSVRPEMVVVAN
jgi:hypothetical protein